MPDVQHLTRTGQFLARVTGLSMLSPRMRRIVLTAPEIAERSWPLGCDIAVVLAGPDGREVRRRYTVRSAAGPELVLDAVLHGHGPGSSWAQSLRLGEQVTFFGPRGELPLPSESSADWLLAVTDEAGLPAVAAVAEAAARPVRVLAEIADDGERYPLPDNAEVRWLPRDGRPPGRPDLLLAALDDVPPGAGFGYLLGESRAIVVVRDALARVGLSRSDVYAKGYWNLNSRPTR
ncbi:MAG: siderophore-interacting protein [Actinobacteria bacterium]|nr:siderophore-interacting protein [Actinomycetota bacterium]